MKMKLRRSRSFRNGRQLKTPSPQIIPISPITPPIMPITPTISIAPMITNVMPTSASLPNQFTFMQNVSTNVSTKRKSDVDMEIDPGKKRRTEEDLTMEIATESGAKFVCPHCPNTVNSDCGDCVTIDAIYSHYSEHHKKFYQCAVCNSSHSTELNVLNHILRDHPNEKIQFYHIPSGMDHIIFIERAKTSLDCNICHSVFETVNQSIEHFKNDHECESIKLTAITMTQRKGANIKTQWQVNNDKDLQIRQLFTCTICKHTEPSMKEMIVHHRNEHQTKSLSYKLSDVLAIVPKVSSDTVTKQSEQFMIYTCVHCQDKNDSSPLYTSAEDVYTHWSNAHAALSDTEPFQFYAGQQVACFHCNVISTFPGLKLHYAKEHPNESMVLCDYLNRKKCIICQYTGDGMIQHFEMDHKLILQTDKVFNPICLSDECLNKLLAINAQNRYKCNYCTCIFESDTELRAHYVRAHSTKEPPKRQIEQNAMVYVDCCQAQLTPINYMNHFPNHINFTCPNCAFMAVTLPDIVSHDLQMHYRINASHQCAMYLNLARSHHLKTKIIFDNGLVVINQNLLHTKYDDTPHCEMMLKEIVEREKGKFHKDQGNGHF